MYSRNSALKTFLKIVQCQASSNLRKSTNCRRSEINLMQIPEKRFDDVIVHLRNSFFIDEPLNRAVNLSPIGKAHPELEQYCIETLKDGCSLMAVNENNQITGVQLSGILIPGYMEKTLEKLSQICDEKFRTVFEFIYEENLKTDIFDKFCVDKCLDLRILSVGKVFRGQGIAAKLVAESDKIACKNGLKMLKADATGIFSQKLLTCLGFQVISEVCYETYEKNGKNPVRHVEPPHDKLKIMYKLIK